MYRMISGFETGAPAITIVGVGGTGGFLAEQICRLLTGREGDVTLVDHDIVEPHNLLRQNFYPDDVGRFKAEALASRLSAQYKRPIRFATKKFEEVSGSLYQMGPIFRIVIGCVDNAAARQAMALYFSGGISNWLIDAGNGEKWGQIIVGNTNHQLLSTISFNQTEMSFSGLPLPTIQEPELLTDMPGPGPDIDCAAALDLTDQDPAINHLMAGWITHMVRRMLAGDCPYMRLSVDLEQGTVNPTYATPEAVAKIMGVKPKNLMRNGPQRNRLQTHAWDYNEEDDEDDATEEEEGEFPGDTGDALDDPAGHGLVGGFDDAVERGRHWPGPGGGDEPGDDGDLHLRDRHGDERGYDDDGDLD